MDDLKMRFVQPRNYSDTFIGGEYRINLQEDPDSLFKLWQAESVDDEDFFKGLFSEEDEELLKL